jgi:hypothetical protein
VFGIAHEVEMEKVVLEVSITTIGFALSIFVG